MPEWLAGPLAASTEQPTVSVWMWAGLALMMIAGLGVLTAARKWGAEAAVSVRTTPELLAQYRRLATRAEQTAATDDEIAYQRAVLDSLRPILARAIAAATEPATRDALREVEERARDLRKALHAAKGTSASSPERTAVAQAAQRLERTLHAARAPMSDDT
jgi:hypothetical protein